MNPRYGDAPVSPTRDLTAPLSGISSAVRAMKVSGVRTPLRNLIVMGTLALALCLLALLSAASPAQALAEGENFKTGQVVVKLDPTIGATIGEINADYGLTTLDDTLGSTGIYLLEVPAGSNTEGMVGRLENDTRLLFAEPNFVAEAPEEPAGDSRHTAWGISGDNSSSEQYAASALGLPCAAAISLGQNTTVAVIDTGAQLDHPDLDENFEGVARYDFVDNDRNPTDRAVGLDEDGAGLKDEALGHGTNVINLSLGSPSRSAILQGVIKDAIAKGVVVAAAAGNSNTSVPHYPAAGNGTAASADGLVAVTSVDRYAKKSDFANYGLWVDMAAPGNDIRSPFPISVYANWSGTSMATPFISGQAALIHQVYGSLRPAGVENKIRNSAQSLTLQNPTYVGMLGAGRADLCASLI